MFQITVAGRVGKVQEVKNVSGTSVLNFSVATDVGFGERKQTVWFDCAIWGKRADSLAPYISTGQQVTVTGEGGERSYETDSGTKHVITIRVSDIALQGGKRDDRDPHAPISNHAQPAGGGFGDDVPFDCYMRGTVS